ncbi:uncharacterized protein DFL_009725 [Arthrobotrys flagrans]|uniref:Uncharacterized protein n=1 Tax=Arthrobotrys flagrans TaxID=97331 RepID=A0A436ZSN1_ARTFL|nr:hypothetical protein DFL_009725 [Arthrobotrys flagrans]
MDTIISDTQAPDNGNPATPIYTKSDGPAAPINVSSNGPVNSINTNSDDPAKPTMFRCVADSVLIPAVALGLATPVVSQGICWVGSKIFKHKMEYETESMMARARAGDDPNHAHGDPIALSREEEEMRKAEISAIKDHFKRRKEDAKVQRQLLKAEKAAMRKNESILAQKLKNNTSPATATTATTATATTNHQSIIDWTSLSIIHDANAPHLIASVG